MINKSISVVTITLNDKEGLIDTLNSLSRLNTVPGEIIIIDGGSTKATIDNFLEVFLVKLPQLIIVSEHDKGIYDAMNKGRNIAKGKLIHYLNSGDIVYGDPYENIFSASLLPVKFKDEKGNSCGYDKLKLHGTAYNHQGIIFPKEHTLYNLNYKIAADYLSIIQTFPNTLSVLPMVDSGGVIYTLGGVSTKRTNLGSLEMISALIFYKPFYAIFLSPVIAIKMLIPSKIRRLFLYYFRN